MHKQYDEGKEPIINGGESSLILKFEEIVNSEGPVYDQNTIY